MVRVRYIIIFWLNIFCCASYANPIDSLVILLNQSSGTKKIDILNLLAEEYRNSNIDSTLKLSELALSEAKKANYTEGIADALHKKGIYYYFLDDSKRAIEYYNQSLDLSKRLKNKRLEAQALSWIGSVYRLQGKHEQSQKLYGEALEIANSINDQKRIIYCLRSIGDVYRMQQKNQLALDHLSDALKICEQIHDQEQKAYILVNLGELYQIQSEYVKAVEALNKALLISKKSKNKNLTAICVYSLGDIFLAKSDYAKALIYFNESLNIAREQKDKIRIVDCYLSIGDVYRLQKEFTKAMEYYKLATSASDEINAPHSKAYCYMVIADIYKTKEQFISALEYLKKSENIASEINDNHRLSEIYSEIGEIHQKKLELDLARIYFNKSLELAERIHNLSTTSTSNIRLAELDYEAKHYPVAITQAQKGLTIAGEIENLENIQDATKLLYKAYRETGQLKLALENLEKYKATSDTLKAHENNKILIQNQMKIEFEKEKEENEILQAKKEAKSASRLEIQRNIIISAVIGFLLVTGFAVYIFIGSKKQKKANFLLERQNSLIENQKKEITDSINYAQRIQTAILPDKDEFFSVFPKSFILYLPKDIVSGDFYYFRRQKSSNGIKQGNFIVAAADCTGHGVPGALMSMISYQKLDEAVGKLREPKNILKRLNKKIKSVLKQKLEDSISRDGLDIALLSCQQKDNNTLKIKYAGAHRPLWIIRKTQHETYELQEPEVSKSSIGGFTEYNQEYQQHEFTLKTDDTLYLFTDGFADQFGGAKNKKITTKNFKKLLLSIQHQSMKDQEILIVEYLNKWKENRPQIDDILVIGIRV